jgi:hypothetical protein
MQPSDLRHEVAVVFGEIVAAKRLIRAGRPVGFDDLDKRISLLCEAAVQLPGEDRQSMVPLLEDLHACLDDLAAALKTSAPSDHGPSSP